MELQIITLLQPTTFEFSFLGSFVVSHINFLFNNTPKNGSGGRQRIWRSFLISFCLKTIFEGYVLAIENPLLDISSNVEIALLEK